MKIEIPITLFKGKDAFPLKTLGDVVKEFEKFLKMLGDDIEIEPDDGEWLFKDVKGGSLSGVAFKAGVQQPKAQSFIHSFEHIVRDPVGEKSNGLIRNKTRRQFANIASNLNPGDAISFGLSRGNKKEWLPLSKEQSLEIIQAVEKQIEYNGTIQGRIHDLQIETTPYAFNIRELSSQKLIKCTFPESLYQKVWEALKKRKGIVYVSGLITASVTDEKIENLKISKSEDIMPAPDYIEGDFDKFVGCCPEIIGGKSLQSWINGVRGRG